MNKIVKHIFFLLFVLTVGHKSFGQLRPRYRAFPNQGNPENRIEAVEERFVLRQLNLPPEQEAKFIPLFREYKRELFNIRRLKRLNSTNPNANSTDQINKDLSYDDQIVKIKMRFKDAFLRILPPDKVSELYKSEREFNDELVRQLSERSSVRAVD